MIAWLFYVCCILAPGSLFANAQRFHRFLHATYAHAQKNFPRAEAWFEKLHKSKNTTKSPWYLKGYVQLLADMNEVFKIEEQIPLLDTHFENDISVQMAIAKALQNTGKSAQAQRRILSLHANHPSDPELTVLAVQAAVASRNITGAIELIERFVNTHPRKTTHAMFYLMEAQLHHINKQPEQALASLRECIECNPRLHNAWLLKAQLEHLLGNTEQAQESHAEYLKLTQQLQTTPSALQLLSIEKPLNNTPQSTQRIHPSTSGPIDSATPLTTLQKLYTYVIHNPQDDQARLKAVQMLLLNKKNIIARSLLTQVLERQPTEAQWYQLLLTSIESSRDLATVEIILRTIIQKHKHLAAPHLFLAQLYLTTGNEQEANQALEMVLRNAANPLHQSTALYLQALLALKQHNATLAISLLQQAHELPIATPKSDLLLLSLYRQYYPSSQQALSIVDTLLRHQPHNARLLHIKSELLLRANKPTEAVDTLHKLAILRPQNQQIQSLLCGTLYQCGRQQDALRLLKKHQSMLFTRNKKSIHPTLVLQQQ